MPLGKVVASAPLHGGFLGETVKPNPGFHSTERGRQGSTRPHQGGLSWALTQEFHLT